MGRPTGKVWGIARRNRKGYRGMYGWNTELDEVEGGDGLQVGL